MPRKKDNDDDNSDAPKKEKVVCGIAPLKKGERRGTMMECAEKRQVRWYGVHKIDKKILDMLLHKDVAKPMTLADAVGKSTGLIARSKRILAEIAKLKRKGSSSEIDKKIKDLEKEYDKVKTEYKKVVPIANKLIKENQGK